MTFRSLSLLVALGVSASATAGNNTTANLDGALSAYVMTPISISVQTPLSFPDVVKPNDGNPNVVELHPANNQISYTSHGAPNGASGSTGLAAFNSFNNAAGMVSSGQTGILRIEGSPGRAYSLQLTVSNSPDGMTYSPTIESGGNAVTTSAPVNLTIDGSIADPEPGEDLINYGGTLTVTSGATAGANTFDLTAVVAYR